MRSVITENNAAVSVIPENDEVIYPGSSNNKPAFRI